MASTLSDTSREVGLGMPAPPLRENLIRTNYNPDAFTVVRETADGMPVLQGHAAVFDQWTEINSRVEGHFLERIAPGAFTKTIGENRDRIKVLFDHGKDPNVGNKPLGPIRLLEEDEQGLRYEVELLDTSYNRDLIPALEAGLLGSSFRFSVLQEQFDKKPARSDHNPNGLAERTVVEVRMPEFGPVVFPAYQGATAGLRSTTDDYLRTLLEVARFDPEDVQALAKMIEMAACFIDDQDEADDAASIEAMQKIVTTLTVLLQGEVTETEPVEPDDGMNAATPDGEERAVWTAAYIDSLPDSAFLQIDAGGSKDAEGKTTPRSLRHFPVKDSAGTVDLPHLRNALARIPQSSLPQSEKDACTAKAKRMLAAMGRSEAEVFADYYRENHHSPESDPSEDTTPPDLNHSESEPSAATTRSKTSQPAGLYPTRKAPTWLLR